MKITTSFPNLNLIECGYCGNLYQKVKLVERQPKTFFIENTSLFIVSYEPVEEGILYYIKNNYENCEFCRFDTFFVDNILVLKLKDNYELVRMNCTYVEVES